MKKLKWLVAGVLMAGMAFLMIAADNTYRPGWYDDKGFTASDMVQFVIDSSTTAGDQIKRFTVTVPVTMLSAGEDTVWTQLFTVPTGQTITIEEVRLSAHTELSGTNDSTWASLLYYTGSPTSALDTMVAMFPTDADSAAYDDTTLTLILVDSVFTAGDIVTFWAINLKGAATGGEGAAISILGRLDE